MLEKIFVEAFGEVERLFAALFLQRYVNLSVRSDGTDIRFNLVACMQVAENLAVIYQTRVFVVDDDFESEVCLLPYQRIHFVANFVFGFVF